MKTKYFRDGLVSGYWMQGSKWEFDWYLHLFFLEEMSFGSNPEHLSLHMAIIGNTYLNPKNYDEVAAAFEGVFEDTQRVEEVLLKQKKVLDESTKVIQEMEEGAFLAEKYETVQRKLSLLMTAVSVGYDRAINKQCTELEEAYSLDENQISEYVVDMSSHTALNESNAKLLKLYSQHASVLSEAHFDFKKLSVDLQEAFEQHADQYGWISTGEGSRTSWTAQDFLRQLKALISKQSIKEKKQDDFLGKVSKSDKAVIKNMIQVSINDNVAADKQVYLDFLFQKHLQEVLADVYDEELLRNLEYKEIVKALGQANYLQSVPKTRRETWRAAWPEKGALNIHYWETEAEYSEFEELVQEKTSEGDVKGSVACTGEAEGIVRIVSERKDLQDFQRGEILVAVKTQPSYVMAMEKAAAFVTDIGGITSHAAIIARELGIPCIVGTENATKVLKNGDKVRVDAINGSVSKLD